MLKIQYIVVAALIKKNNKVLLVFKHSSSSQLCINKWELPGGIAEFGLSFEEALNIKIKNYLGVDIKYIKLLPHVVSNVSEEENAIKHMYVLVGECELLSQNIKLNEDKLSDYKWVSLEDAVDLNRKNQLVKGDLDFIKIALL